ncbi:DEAD/DEAH box helicase family protein [Paenibacillus monticola]|uniref:Helicase/UvrB N-terminal domain-containing protein n=1 Tax=Paenibacillus monticola TaxID=2666075 RepID=A0A7X2H347_9BACL|nr:DEAD/DEAH box helicase family protein [Paenibacillus monticola]MRN52655.1 hypothetical protein [Paenibacillus monticola]
MYFSNQQQIIDRIINGIEENKKLFMISGPSGSGKSYITEQIQKVWSNGRDNNSLVLAGEDYLADAELHPFNKCFSGNEQLKKNFWVNKSKKTLSKLPADVPWIGSFLESFVFDLLHMGESQIESYNSSLTKEQLDMVFKLRYILFKGNFLICIDNLHWWDKSSLDLLFELLEGRKSNMGFLSNVVFIINITTNQTTVDEKRVERIKKNFNFSNYNAEVISKEEYGNVLTYLGLTKQLDNKLVELLYSATNGHLLVTQDIIKYINDNEFTDQDEYSSFLKNTSLSILIEERLKNYGAKGEIVTEVLKYASIIGRSFTFLELESLTKKSKFEIKDIIGKANDLSLVETGDERAQFIHEIVRELFYSKLCDNKSFYYNAAAEALKIVAPAKYLTRANFLLQAGLIKEGSVLYIIEYLRKLRLKEIVDIEYTRSLMLYAKELPDDRYINIMKISYNLYHSQEYEKCIAELDTIENMYPQLLLAERDYLMSICLSKQIESRSRHKAVNCLELYSNFDQLEQEGEIWSRIMSALMVAYVHIDDSINAEKTNKALFMYLGNRAAYDVEAQDKINILRRKSAAVCSTTTALRFTKRSVEYFEPQEGSNIPLSPFEYYMALNNFAANAIVCGQFIIAFESMIKVFNLVKFFSEMEFPRKEIIMNNYIISGFLSGCLTVEQGIQAYNQVFEQINFKHSDHVLLRMNQASLYASNYDVHTARAILYSLVEELENKENVEIYYQYCVESNLMVVEYLCKNKDKALELWNKLTVLQPIIGDKVFYVKRNNMIKKIFDQEIVSDGKMWLNMLLEVSPHSNTLDNIDLWEFYGKGYLFSDTQFWSES